jgi:anti-sigma regulatory factor (Ser/Thr protein kinase)
MEDLSLHILDIAENSIAAGARNIHVTITEDAPADLFLLEVRDDGKGMGPDELKMADDPFFSTKPAHGIGLGLALLKQMAIEANGAMKIESVPGSGTTVTASFQASHPNRKPLGNMADTITAIVTECEEVDVVFVHSREGKRLVFDTKEIREELAGAPFQSAKARMVIRGFLNQEEESLTL